MALPACQGLRLATKADLLLRHEFFVPSRTLIFQIELITRNTHIGRYRKVLELSEGSPRLYEVGRVLSDQIVQAHGIFSCARNKFLFHPWFWVSISMHLCSFLPPVRVLLCAHSSSQDVCFLATMSWFKWVRNQLVFLVLSVSRCLTPIISLFNVLRRAHMTFRLLQRSPSCPSPHLIHRGLLCRLCPTKSIWAV